MKYGHRQLESAVAVLLLLVAACALVRSGAYGFTVFLVVPIFVGAIGAWAFRPSSAGRAAGIGAFSVALSSFSFLLLGVEGLTCILMALPLAVPMGAVGGLVVYTFGNSRLGWSGTMSLLLIPFGTLSWDFTAHSTLFEVRSAIEIAAPPEVVWRHVISFSDLPEPDEWYFRAGLAYPMRARIQGSGPGAVRYCEFSTGPFIEPIEVWDEPRLLRFRVTHNPAPMQEWTIYQHVLPKHLRGYLISKRGQFRLTALPGNRTRLEGTTWYQHGLWPGEYWRWWSDAIIHRIHLRVLNHIRDLAENRAG